MQKHVTVIRQRGSGQGCLAEKKTQYEMMTELVSLVVQVMGGNSEEPGDEGERSPCKAAVVQFRIE